MTANAYTKLIYSRPLTSDEIIAISTQRMEQQQQIDDLKSQLGIWTNVVIDSTGLIEQYNMECNSADNLRTFFNSEPWLKRWNYLIVWSSENDNVLWQNDPISTIKES